MRFLGSGDHRIRAKVFLRKLVTSRRRMLSLAVAIVSILVLLEWRLDFDFSLGILYIFPVMIAATWLNRWQIVLAAIFCAYTRGLFTADETQLEHTLRFCMATIAYTGCGLLIYQIAQSRRIVLRHYAHIRFEQKLRRQAEEQLRLMAESSPAAILTVGATGEILAANIAAQSMFLTHSTNMLGRLINESIPMFAEALRLPNDIGGIRTQAQTWARKEDGTQFPVAAWFSIYGAGEGKRLAAIVVDVSDEIREREQAHYQDLVQQNRLFASTVSHEIRNLCASVAVIQRNMKQRLDLADDEDFNALTQLVAALKDMSSFDLQNRSRNDISTLSVPELADELKVVVGQDWRDIGGKLQWDIDPAFPLVQADRQGLLQVLINLSQNALRAVVTCEKKVLAVSTSVNEQHAVLRVCDSGTGVSDPLHLFQPFRPGANSGGSGLGLYVSRAIIRSFGGDLRHIPSATGCCFEILLCPVMTEHKDKMAATA